MSLLHITTGLWWDCCNETRFLSIVNMSYTNPPWWPSKVFQGSNGTQKTVLGLKYILHLPFRIMKYIAYLTVIVVVICSTSASGNVNTILLYTCRMTHVWQSFQVYDKVMVHMYNNFMVHWCTICVDLAKNNRETIHHRTLVCNIPLL